MDGTVKKLVTHDGSFHTDDVFACATLAIMLEKKGEAFEIIRTRDEKIMKSADYIFDVGGVHAPEENRFDHHQIGGAGKHENGIDYAAFGLVWKKYGSEVSGGVEAAKVIEKSLVTPIDAFDNAIDLVENKFAVTPYYLQHVFGAMRPTWREEDVNIDQVFLKAVDLAKQILIREIVQATDALEASRKIQEIYEQTEDKRIIILDKNYAADEVTYDSIPETLFIIFPRRTNNYWGAKSVRVGPRTFKNKKDFPALWAGLRDEELINVSGVRDAVFCHRGRFMVVAKTKEAAIELAKLALEL